MDWEIAANFGKRIKDLRDALGGPGKPLSQEALAGRAQVNPQQISNWEGGRQRPHQKSLTRWANREGWSVDIFAEGGPMPSASVSNSVNARSQDKATRLQKKLADATGAISRAQDLLAAGSTEDAEEMLRRHIRFDDWELDDEDG